MHASILNKMLIFWGGILLLVFLNTQHCLVFGSSEFEYENELFKNALVLYIGKDPNYHHYSYWLHENEELFLSYGIKPMITHEPANYKVNHSILVLYDDEATAIELWDAKHTPNNNVIMPLENYFIARSNRKRLIFPYDSTDNEVYNIFKWENDIIIGVFADKHYKEDVLQYYNNVAKAKDVHTVYMFVKERHNVKIGMFLSHIGHLEPTVQRKAFPMKPVFHHFKRGDNSIIEEIDMKLF